MASLPCQISGTATGLPTELWEKIVVDNFAPPPKVRDNGKTAKSTKPDAKTLKALSLTCKFLRDIAQPALFRHNGPAEPAFAITFAKSSRTKWHKLYDVLIANASLGQAVQSLALDLSYPGDLAAVVASVPMLSRAEIFCARNGPHREGCCNCQPSPTLLYGAARLEHLTVSLSPSNSRPQDYPMLCIPGNFRGHLSIGFLDNHLSAYEGRAAPETKLSAGMTSLWLDNANIEGDSLVYLTGSRADQALDTFSLRNAFSSLPESQAVSVGGTPEGLETIPDWVDLSPVAHAFGRHLSSLNIVSSKTNVHNLIGAFTALKQLTYTSSSLVDDFADGADRGRSRILLANVSPTVEALHLDLDYIDILETLVGVALPRLPHLRHLTVDVRGSRVVRNLVAESTGPINCELLRYPTFALDMACRKRGIKSDPVSFIDAIEAEIRMEVEAERQRQERADAIRQAREAKFSGDGSVPMGEPLGGMAVPSNCAPS